MKTSCPFCAQASQRRLRARDTNRSLNDAELFDYYECAACGLWFLYPVPTDLQERYPPEYYALPGPAQFAEGMQAEAYKIELLRPYRRGGSLLEIGPACGYFAGAAQKAGYDVSVIEMSSACCAYMRDKGGIDVHESSDVPGTLATMAPLQVIALWHVIEHVPDPWSLLRAAAERLAAGGVLALATPNPDALQFKILGASWTHLDAPRHVYLLPIQHLVSFLSGLGLTIREATCLDEGSRSWNTFGWEESLGHLTKRGRRFSKGLGRGVARLMAPLDHRDGAGSAYTIIAVKEPSS